MATSRIYKTVKPSGQGGDYTSLQSAISDNAQNLVVNDKYLDIEISGRWTSADTTQVVITGYTTDALRYINIYTTDEARHKGVYNASTAYAITQTSTMPLNFNWGSGNVIYIKGLQLKTTIGAGDVAGSPVINFFNTSASGMLTGYFRYNILVEDISAKTTLTSCDALASYITAGGNTTIYAHNNIVYCIGTFTTGSGAGISQGGVGQICYAYNNTVIGFDVNFNQYTSSTFVAKNNISQYSAGAINVDYSTMDASSVTNISQDATSPNSAFRNKTVAFVNHPDKNYHLSSADTQAKNNGTDLSGDAILPFNDDIDNLPRETTWDIGADEVFTPQSSPSPINITLSIPNSYISNVSTITFYNRFKKNLMSGLVDMAGSGSHSMKCALLTSSYTFNQDHNYFTTVSTAETSGTGYTAGGVTLTNALVDLLSGVFAAYFTASDVSWNNSSFSSRYAVIYDNTLVTKDLILCIDFGQTITTTNSSLLLDFNTRGLIILL